MQVAGAWLQLMVILLLGKSADDFASRQAAHSVSLMISVNAQVRVFTVGNYLGLCFRYACLLILR